MGIRLAFIHDMSIFLSFLPTLILAIPGLAHASSYEAPQETLVHNLGRPRLQGDTGFCYGFTMAEALQQLVCKASGSDCQKDSDDVSVLNVLRGPEGVDIPLLTGSIH